MQQPLPTTAPLNAPPYTILATREYLTQLTTDIARTVNGDRIMLATMDLHPQGFGIPTILDACIAAVKRGVTVTISVDAHTFLMDPFGHIGPLWYGRMRSRTRSKWFAPSEQAIARLRNNGVTVALTNPPARPFTSPVSGRSHIKASIINDVIYVGGHNLSYGLLDCMVRSRQPATADWLYALLAERATKPTTRAAWGLGDFTHTIDAQSHLTIDVGSRGQSRIYDEALALIDQATTWLFLSCQFFPRGKTAAHLQAAADRGVAVYTMFNGPGVHPPGIGRLAHMTVNAHERLHRSRALFQGELPKGTPYVHAKILATGDTGMIGSHNYIQEGVRFGTAELALSRSDPAFSKALVQSIMQQAGLTRDPWYQHHIAGELPT